MKFLLGMIFGGLCAVGVMMFPEAREAVLAELDLQTRAISEITRGKSLQSIKSSFLDESVYSDIVNAADTLAETKPVLWVDQIVSVDTVPLLEPVAVPSTPVPVVEPVVSVIKQADVDVALAQAELPDPVFHAVWSPFRSERSATGFASTLSARLNREFRVVRLSAGRYEVGFDYSSDQELLYVLDSVLEFTGTGVSNQQVRL